jgi:carbamoyltransferase
VTREVTVGWLPVGHDPSIALVDETGVIAVAEEERYSQIKRGRFVTDPEWIFDVLAEFGVAPEEVTCLTVPNIVALQERRRPDSLRAVPRLGQARLVAAMVNRVVVGLPRLDSVEHHRHHLCHAASTYLASPHDRAAIVTVDGMGELETATTALGTDGHIETVETTTLPNSLGYIYQALSWWSGLTGGEREGKFMGLASWGSPARVEHLRHSFGDVIGGEFRVSDRLASAPTTASAWYAYTEAVLGPRRLGDPDTPDPVAADVAASIQVIVEEALLAYCAKARERTGSTNLCLAGGVFMNTVANGAIQRSGLFESVFVQPLASDNGLALGAALLSHRRRSATRRRWVMTTAALGTSIAHEEGLTDGAAVMVEEAAKRILAGEVIGWARGRAEVGARALGQRSVFADARDPTSGDRINHKLKRREHWRPFAPMVLEEDALEWGLSPSPFMTSVHRVPDQVRMAFPAVCHVDGTARVQTVPHDADPVLRALLLRIRDEIGVGICLNTSLNGPGMPIARTREQVLDLFGSSNLDAVVIGTDLLGRDDLPQRSRCLCGGDPIETLIELVAPEPGSCIEAHARSIHCVALSAATETSPLHSAAMPAFTGEEQVTVLVPTWIDLLAECAPRLTAWLTSFQDQFSSPITVVDSAGRRAGLADLAATGRPGLGGNASEVEIFWLAGVARWST